jgi:hypothetical protein
MSDEVRVWQVTKDDSLKEIKASTLDREERIEKWITQDISVLEPDNVGLLVIGQQVKTDFGKKIDLLCIDSEGDLVIVELKRDKTPRDVTAQALDYASWIKDLGKDKVEEIAAEYLNGKQLKEAFEEAFDSTYPDVINNEHSIKVVASEVDDSTERIVRYLSSYGIDINFVRFQMLRADDQGELLVRTFTIPPVEAEQNTRRSGKTKRTSSPATIAERMEESTNPAEIAFLGRRLSDQLQEIGKRKDRLLYRIADQVRFILRARAAHVHVIQQGRFSEDERFWRTHLSNPSVGYRHGRAHLSFHLHNEPDYVFFEQMMNQRGQAFQWATTLVGDNEAIEDGDEE